MGTMTPTVRRRGEGMGRLCQPQDSSLLFLQAGAPLSPPPQPLSKYGSFCLSRLLSAQPGSPTTNTTQPVRSLIHATHSYAELPRNRLAWPWRSWPSAPFARLVPRPSAPVRSASRASRASPPRGSGLRGRPPAPRPRPRPVPRPGQPMRAAVPPRPGSTPPAADWPAWVQCCPRLPCTWGGSVPASARRPLHAAAQHRVAWGSPRPVHAMAKRSSLSIRIVEAKNLPAKDM